MTKVREEIVLSTEIRQVGNSWVVGIRAKDVEKLGMEHGSDVDVVLRRPKYVKKEEE